MALISATVLAQAGLFQIRTTHLPLPERGKTYDVRLIASGGTPPYHWAVLEAPLPEGLLLDANSGVISGRVAGSGEDLQPVLVQVADSATPPLVETRLLPFSRGGPLNIAWATPPAVAGGEMAGAVKVSNDSGEDVTVTVMVMAVNVNGKAFALRYDHRDLGSGNATPELTFQVQMPSGEYVVHVDAVAEVPANGEIFRDRREVAGLVVPPSG